MEKIVSFEIVTLHLSWMRGVADYELTVKDGEALLSLYHPRYENGKDVRVLDKSVPVPPEQAIKLLNDCKLMSWDGFSGKHPRGVLDGTMFRLDAVVNDGKKIHADGSQNFPKGYYELKDAFYRMLDE